jgi:hypothetical protein
MLTAFRRYVCIQKSAHALSFCQEYLQRLRSLRMRLLSATNICSGSEVCACAFFRPGIFAAAQKSAHALPFCQEYSQRLRSPRMRFLSARNIRSGYSFKPMSPIHLL